MKSRKNVEERRTANKKCDFFSILAVVIATNLVLGFVNPIGAAEGYMCENDDYNVYIYVSDRTVNASDQDFSDETETMTVASDTVIVWHKPTNTRFRFAPILYTQSGGGDARFQVIDRESFSYRENNMMFDMSYDHEQARLEGRFIFRKRASPHVDSDNVYHDGIEDEKHDITVPCRYLLLEGRLLKLSTPSKK